MRPTNAARAEATGHPASSAARPAGLIQHKLLNGCFGPQLDTRHLSTVRRSA
jgi:hypothetical protein